MSYDKIATLVSRLASKTESGELTWDATEDAQTFQVAFPSYAVRIEEKFEPEYDVQYVEISIHDSEGRAIEAVTSGDVSSLITDADVMMRGLYQTARRQALGVESALDEILENLGPEESAFGPPPPARNDDDLPF